MSMWQILMTSNKLLFLFFLYCVCTFNILHLAAFAEQWRTQKCPRKKWRSTNRIYFPKKATINKIEIMVHAQFPHVTCICQSCCFANFVSSSRSVASLISLSLIFVKDNSPGLVALKTSLRMCDVVPVGYRVSNRTSLFFCKFLVCFNLKLSLNKLSCIPYHLALRHGVAHFVRRFQSNKSWATEAHCSSWFVRLKASQKICDVSSLSYRVDSITYS